MSPVTHFLMGWAVGALVTLLAWVWRAGAGGGGAEQNVVISIVESGVYALSFRLVAFAFSGAPATTPGSESMTRIV